MKKRFQLCALFLYLGMAFCSASNGLEETEGIKKLRTAAETYFENHQYKEALDIYLQLEGKTIDKGMISYMIGMCYLSSDEKNKAADYLVAAKETNEPSFVINYYLGRVFFEAGHYVKALNYFSTYLKELSSIDGLTFKPYKNIPEDHLIHYQKSARDVNRLMDKCRYGLKNAN